ncbi:uncharacterized protein [Notamacropus eugenii]|uniref:uncharacterized protein isoform X3 n=1 Tax=Notamacropus eugenii TaxID=9315 RepID=UPI003B67F68F
MHTHTHTRKCLIYEDVREADILHAGGYCFLWYSHRIMISATAMGLHPVGPFPCCRHFLVLIRHLVAAPEEAGQPLMSISRLPLGREWTSTGDETPGLTYTSSKKRETTRSVHLRDVGRKGHGSKETLVEGMLLGSISVFYHAEELMWAVGGTSLVTWGLILLAQQTKFDFTSLSANLWVLLLVLILYGTLYSLMRTYWLRLIFAALGTLFFSVG